LSHLLFDLIREHDPGATGPDFQKWAVHIERLVRRDGRSPADIEAAIRWCQADDFWHSNILSTKKLREKFQTLFLRMKGQTRHAGQSAPTRNRDFTDQRSDVGCIIET
jgi:hypothetical protein